MEQYFQNLYQIGSAVLTIILVLGGAIIVICGPVFLAEKLWDKGLISSRQSLWVALAGWMIEIFILILVLAALI